MRGSLISSAVLHVLALTWALVSISAPESFDVADVEALPVDIVPIEEITQIQQGDKTAPVAEKSAPVPTKKPTSVPDAQNVGENKVDLKSVPKPAEKPTNAESSAAPEKVEKVQPTQDDQSNDIKDIIKEETVADTPKPTEVAKAEPPKPEVTPEPKPPAESEPKPEEAQAEEIPLPDSVPVPTAKPKPEKPKPAETKPAESKPTEAEAPKSPDKKKDTKTQETAKSKSTKESDFNADEVAALLNKNDPTAGGAKASQDKAAFGGKKTTGGSKLSQSEMDALKGAIQNNWSFIPGLAGMDGMVITVRFKLDESGNLIGEPEVSASGGEASTQQVMMGSARRAILRSAPFANLPPDKYDAWSEVVVNFDPSEMM
jgi:outer membrane biosynthesis protein TonB